MIELQMLGRLELRAGSGTDPGRVLAQPKRLALLAYLAAASPAGFHQRDTLTALFWPEHDQEHARAALRNAVHFLRRALGPQLLLSRGDDLGIATGQCWCDVVALEAFLASGDRERALALYNGDLLEGFHLDDAPEFERWLETRRASLRRIAHSAARALAGEHEKQRVYPIAIQWLHRALRITPEDEASLRSLIILLDQSGDRGQALAVYDAFAHTLRHEFEIEPSPETQALVAAVRGRRATSLVPAREQAEPARRTSLRDADITEDDSRRIVERTAESVRAPRAGSNRWPKATVMRSTMAAILVVGAVVAITASPERNPQLELRRVVVAPFENRTGRSELASIGVMATDEVIRDLVRHGAAEVVPTGVMANAVRRIQARNGITPAEVGLELATRTGSGLLVAGTYELDGDSVRMWAEVLDASTRKPRAVVGPFAAPVGRPAMAIAPLRSRVVGVTTALVDSTNDERLRVHGLVGHPRSLEGQREFRKGMDLFIQSRDYEGSLVHFRRAFAVDTMDSQSLLQRSFVHWTLGQYDSVEALTSRLRPRRERLAEQDRRWFDLWEAKLRGDRQRALEMNRQLRAGTRSGGWELQGGYQALTARRPREALEILADADLERGLLKDLWAVFELHAEAHHALGSHMEELPVAKEGRKRHPELLSMLISEIQALAALRRIEEVHDLLRQSHTLPPQSGRSPSMSPRPTYTQGVVMMVAASELRAHGESDAARMVADEALRWYRTRAALREATDSTRASLGEAMYAFGALRDARILFRELSARNPDHVAYLGRLGVVAARQGDHAAALAIGDSLKRWSGRYLFGEHTLWRARIAARLEDRDAAVALVHESLAQGYPFGIELHRDPDLEQLSGMPAFRQILHPTH